MLASPADWISPGSRDGFRDDPPAWDGKKVSLLDTDHVWGIGGNRPWVWKAFLRGHNPLFMDPYDGSVLGKRFDTKWDPIRRNLGFARRLANRINLAAMTPHGELASTKYCLAAPGASYLVYVPEGQKALIDLTTANGKLAVEWFDCTSGKIMDTQAIEGGMPRKLDSPIAGDAILYLQSRG